MNNIEIAKQRFHHQDYTKALNLFTSLTTSGEVSLESILYPEILCYLGNCKLRLYEIYDKKTFLNDALTDFITAENSIRIYSHSINSKSVSEGIITCNNYFSTS